MTDENKNDPEELRPQGEGVPADAGAPDSEDLAPEDDSPATAEGVTAGEPGGEPLSDADQTLLDQAAADIVAEMRSDMLRAQAELVNFRARVERDRQANREAVIAEVIRSLLPAIDDLDRAEAHGDLEEGTPLAIIASKLRAGFAKYGLTKVGEKGEVFDPNRHEALVQLPTPDATQNTVADVIEPGYLLGERLIRAAKVAVAVPAAE
ncbi:nucleotide exchange factor GrpE [Herbiconiux sp. SYSU D00978]|uniref:nucleotide exchange factor GrpE n=1 Tax=Herbiconiux sp. SYSU D00978 TaxID=2812562 RepID=UPI001F60D963|nr:nucleotide exchange factor GrpE [Herbiconiux sp. SYSU D00978]